jgi:hypothetical protein
VPPRAPAAGACRVQPRLTLPCHAAVAVHPPHAVRPQFQQSSLTPPGAQPSAVERAHQLACLLCLCCMALTMVREAAGPPIDDDLRSHQHAWAACCWVHAAMGHAIHGPHVAAAWDLGCSSKRGCWLPISPCCWHVWHAAARERRIHAVGMRWPP